MTMMQRTDRRAAFKKTVDASDGRRRREETNRQIRKNKKEEVLRKRRLGSVAVPSAAGGDSTVQNNTKKKYSTVQEIPEMFAILKSSESPMSLQIEATRGFRRILSVERDPPVDLVLGAGVLPIFVTNLTARPAIAELIFESAWALTNIASTTKTSAVVEGGGVPPLIRLLQHENADVREQAAWCLGNIAGDNKDYRDLVLREGALPALLMNVQTPANMSLLGNVTWAISNLCRGKPAPDLHYVAPAIQTLSVLITKDVSTDVLVDAVWALSYLSDGDNERIARVMENGITNTLISFLEDKKSPLLTPTIRCLGNFVTGNDDQTQVVLDAGILNHLSELLDNPRKSIRKETCWVASNIAAGTHKQIFALMRQTGVMQKIVDLASSASWEVRKEALWTLSNICTTGDNGHAQTVVQCEGLYPLADVLSVGSADPTVLCACLDAVERILEVGEQVGLDYGRLFDEYQGIDHLEQLQEHPSDAVYKKTIKIIENHFGGEDAEDENLLPATSENGTFGFGISSPKQLFPTDTPVFHFGHVSNRAY